MSAIAPRSYDEIRTPPLHRVRVPKLHDKRAALVDLGRHLGLFETKRKHDGTIEVATNVREFWVVDELRKIAGANMADYVQYTPDTSILRR
jgi:hypothetical protein